MNHWYFNLYFTPSNHVEQKYMEINAKTKKFYINALKKKIYNIYILLLHLLVLFSCCFNLTKLCAYIINISLFQPAIFKKKSKSKKIIIVLDRFAGGGRRDIELTYKSSSRIPNILFLRRSFVKLIFYYFGDRSKLFGCSFNFSQLNNKTKYFNLNNKNRKKLDQFWTTVIFNLKKYHDNKKINIIAFAYYYNTEFALYAACNNNEVPVKLWNKECFMSEPDMKYRVRINEYRKVFKFFDQISVYNNSIKKMLIAMDKSNEKKISVNGSPRLHDFISKTKKKKNIKNLLFLTFNSTPGIPPLRKNKDLNWNFSHNKIVEILNDLCNNKNLNIIIKRKNYNSFKTHHQIDKRIKVFEGSNAKTFINQADIIIGHNSGSTIEALANGKYVMVPFFEKNQKLKKYLYKFNKDIIYNSEYKMKKDIPRLVGKKVLFPLENKHNKATAQYFLGNFKNGLEKYVSFLNN